MINFSELLRTESSQERSENMDTANSDKVEIVLNDDDDAGLIDMDLENVPDPKQHSKPPGKQNCNVKYFLGLVQTPCFLYAE